MTSHVCFITPEESVVTSVRSANTLALVEVGDRWSDVSRTGSVTFTTRNCIDQANGSSHNRARPSVTTL